MIEAGEKLRESQDLVELREDCLRISEFLEGYKEQNFYRLHKWKLSACILITT